MKEMIIVLFSVLFRVALGWGVFFFETIYLLAVLSFLW